MITFLITACNEKTELKENLKFVNAFKQKGDEVLILLDEEKLDDEIFQIAKSNSDRVILKSLNKDFSAFKNFGLKNAKNNYVLHLDADEIINALIIQIIRNIITNNNDISGIHIPRINIVNNSSSDDLAELNFKINENGWINWPDYQPRFVNKSSGIYFINKVHETFNDHSKTVFLEASAHFALLHIKDINKQKQQNQFYDTI
jgi:glycosyltransferase involved in cell wall biosynthesis